MWMRMWMRRRRRRRPFYRTAAKYRRLRMKKRRRVYHRRRVPLIIRENYKKTIVRKVDQWNTHVWRGIRSVAPDNFMRFRDKLRCEMLTQDPQFISDLADYKYFKLNWFKLKIVSIAALEQQAMRVPPNSDPTLGFKSVIGHTGMNSLAWYVDWDLDHIAPKSPEDLRQRVSSYNMKKMYVGSFKPVTLFYRLPAECRMYRATALTASSGWKPSESTIG
ncbi:putative capsid protein [Pacific flying fox faeces associated circular DNA virus-6]|uniref:Putative capsid protein n=1 Tax=Pacific flying fox faeces associated circular DNA virus-6 TaxID=1796015 RepID=A0A140CTU0_9VIRU|nr:putative capsid protein [Pacific flying fox faeces associated circular DNA virus-6]